MKLHIKVLKIIWCLYNKINITRFHFYQELSETPFQRLYDNLLRLFSFKDIDTYMHVIYKFNVNKIYK